MNTVACATSRAREYYMTSEVLQHMKKCTPPSP